MTSPYYLPICSSTETTKTNGLPSPAAGSSARLDVDGDKVTLHVVVSFAIFFTFSVSAGHLLDLGRWHDVVINAIVFLYLAVMLNLLLVKRRDEKRRRLEACQVIISGPKVTSSLMWVATGIMLVSLGAAGFVLRPDWLDLAVVALCILASVVAMLVLLLMAAFDKNKRLTTKCEHTSDEA